MGRKKVSQKKVDNSDDLYLTDYLADIELSLELMIKCMTQDDFQGILSSYEEIISILDEIRNADWVCDG